MPDKIILVAGSNGYLRGCGSILCRVSPWIFIYICIYVYMYMCMYICIFVYMYICIYVYMYNYPWFHRV